MPHETDENGAKQGAVSFDEATKIIKDSATGFKTILRSPILDWPSNHGLKYEDVNFPSQDGTSLEGWLIPCSGSDKLVIANHPRNFNRYGCPTHMEPFKSLGSFADPGNALEVNFVPDYKILHDAGYNVLAYDMRNHGQSSAANGGISVAGRFEARDVIGSLQYARGREDLKHMKVGLFSRCNGANATMFAMHTQPDYFKDVCCLVAPQPLSVQCITQRSFEHFGVFDRMEDFDKELKFATSYGLDDMSPVPWAKSISTPTFIYQVRDDKLTYESDVQAMYDNIPIEDKKLHWITDTAARWDGYREFQKRPKPMLEWFDEYM